MNCSSPQMARLCNFYSYPDTAYAKNKMNQKWYNFDDSHVSEVGKDHIVVRSH